MKKLLLFFVAVMYVAVAKAQNYVPDKARNLNIVYFVPTDATPLDNYEERLSKVVIFYQQWFGEQMKNNGYVDGNGNGKTFGLVKDNAAQRVKIHRYNANLPGSGYSPGGNGDMKREVETYFANNPGLKTSQHVLVFWVGITNGPYVGAGTYCFVNDDLRTSMDQANTGFVNAIGGPAHELGHALNLPHNAGRLSDYTNPQTGSALMSTGLFQLTRSPVFLTPADCAILNSNELFKDEDKVFYESASATVTAVHAIYDLPSRNIKFSGRVSANRPIDAFTFYVDPNYENEGTGVNLDYNAITWATKPIGTDSFYVEIPIDELTIKYPSGSNGSNPFIYPYELKIRTVHNNGAIAENRYNFTFNDDYPVLPFSMPINNTAVDRTGWTAIASTRTGSSGTFLDENRTTGNESASAVIDNDYGTFWHSRYSGITAAENPFPHEIVIDTKSVQTFVGWGCNQRRGGTNRAVKTASIYVSNDNINYTFVKTYTLQNVPGVQYAAFDKYENFRYFKFVAENAWDGQAYAAMSDIKLYTGPDPATQVINVPPATLVSSNGWTVKAGTKLMPDGVTTFEDENNNGESGWERAESIIDNNVNSFWHSKYDNIAAAQQSFNHEIVIDTKTLQRFTGWSYVQRNGNGSTRAIKDAEIYLGDENENYTLLETREFANNTDLNKFVFGEKYFRYFKIVSKSAWDTQRYAALAEVSLYNDPNITSLPVELLAFDAKAKGSTVSLQWATASEQKAAYFDVVRLMNENKVLVSKVFAKGNATAPQNYQATDFNPQNGINYYQLLQYDTDGKLATQSAVKTVAVMGRSLSLDVKSVGNGTVGFTLYAERAGSYTVYVTNLLGQKIAVKKVAVQQGGNTFDISYHGYGVHLLTAENGSEKLTKKFMAN